MRLSIGSPGSSGSSGGVTGSVLELVLELEVDVLEEELSSGGFGATEDVDVLSVSPPLDMTGSGSLSLSGGRTLSMIVLLE